MKKILETLNKPQKTFVRFCPNCLTKFSYQNDDIEGFITDDLYVTCPKCNYELIHNDYSTNFSTEQL